MKFEIMTTISVEELSKLESYHHFSTDYVVSKLGKLSRSEIL